MKRAQARLACTRRSGVACVVLTSLSPSTEICTMGATSRNSSPKHEHRGIGGRVRIATHRVQAVQRHRQAQHHEGATATPPQEHVHAGDEDQRGQQGHRRGQRRRREAAPRCALSVLVGDDTQQLHGCSGTGCRPAPAGSSMRAAVSCAPPSARSRSGPRPRRHRPPSRPPPCRRRCGRTCPPARAAAARRPAAPASPPGWAAGGRPASRTGWARLPRAGSRLPRCGPAARA